MTGPVHPDERAAGGIAVVALSGARADEVALVGGKAAGLARLVRGGITVPEGLVLTTEVCAAPDALAPAIDEVWARLGDGTLAVRSSAPAEDGTDRSFAGVHASVLGVGSREALGAAVAEVLESRHRAAARAYAAGDPGPAPMAVLVQRQVAADCAGVALTRNPVTGADEVVVSAVPGLGDGLERGDVEVDEWIVREGTARRVGWGTVLGGEEAVAVAALARRVGAVVGEPCDVEWARAGGRLHVVQARPLTALRTAPVWRAPVAGCFSRAFRIGEWLSDPVTPLAESWLLADLERHLWAQMRRVAGPALPVPEPAHLVVEGWYFASMDFVPETARGRAALVAGVARRVLAGDRRALLVFPPLARFGVRAARADWEERLEPRLRAATAALRERVARAPSAPELVRGIDELVAVAGEVLLSMTGVAGYAWKAELALARFCHRHLPGAVDSVTELVVGLGGIEAPRVALASLDWYFPAVETHAAPLEPSSRQAAARRVEVEAEARRRLAGRRQRARFERLLAVAQAYGRVREHQVAALTEPWLALRDAVLGLSGAIAGAVPFGRPDDVFFCRSDEVRALASGRTGVVTPLELRTRRAEWQRRRALTPPLVLGSLPRALRGLDRVIAQTWGTPAAAEATDVDRGREGAADAVGLGRVLVAGSAAAPGRASGPVRVLFDPADADALRAGEVLVAPCVTAAWITCFTRAAAVVTDGGSVTSHASLLVREFGVPAVIGCRDATARLRTGQVVRVDGSAGLVRS